MKIAHVLSSFAVGGAEFVALRLAETQMKAGHQVEILGLRDGPLAARAEQMGIAVHPMSSRRLRLAYDLAAIFARRRYDVVNSHNPPAHRFSRLCRAVGTPVLLCTRHGEMWPWAPEPRLFSPPFTDGVIAVSAPVAATFQRTYPAFADRRLAMVPNGVEPPPAGGEAPIARLRKPGFTVLYLAARLDPVKDLSTLLRAFALARVEQPIQLVIAGDGPDRERLERLALELGVASDVAFLGFRDDAVKLYPGADVFVLSSTAEGMSLSLLEAMAAGLPAVVTRVGSNPELVDEGTTGLLVEPGQPRALANAIVRLAADPAQRRAMGAAGRARALAHYSHRTTADRYLAIYERVLGADLVRRMTGRVAIADL